MCRPFATGKVVRRQVQHEVAKLCLVEHQVAGAAREGAHAGEQLFVLKGLGHVVVGAGVEAAHLVGRGGAGGQQHDRGGVSAVAQVTDDLHPVLAGEHDVEDHRVVGA